MVETHETVTEQIRELILSVPWLDRRDMLFEATKDMHAYIRGCFDNGHPDCQCENEE